GIQRYRPLLRAATRERQCHSAGIVEISIGERQQIVVHRERPARVVCLSAVIVDGHARMQNVFAERRALQQGALLRCRRGAPGVGDQQPQQRRTDPALDEGTQSRASPDEAFQGHRQTVLTAFGCFYHLLKAPPIQGTFGRRCAARCYTLGLHAISRRRATVMNSTISAADAGVFHIGGDIAIHRLGFGAMRVTGRGVWGEPADREEALRTLRRLPELGVNFIDTADSYGPGVSEELLREALHPYGGILIATKGGLVRTGPDVWIPL